jgi:hypothetical protein
MEAQSRISKCIDDAAFMFVLGADEADYVSTNILTQRMYLCMQLSAGKLSSLHNFCHCRSVGTDLGIHSFPKPSTQRSLDQVPRVWFQDWIWNASSAFHDVKG